MKNKIYFTLKKSIYLIIIILLLIIIIDYLNSYVNILNAYDYYTNNYFNIDTLDSEKAISSNDNWLLNLLNNKANFNTHSYFIKNEYLTRNFTVQCLYNKNVISSHPINTDFCDILKESYTISERWKLNQEILSEMNKIQDILSEMKKI